jgi:hypothetical protein
VRCGNERGVEKVLPKENNSTEITNLETFPQGHGHGLGNLLQLNVGHGPDGEATNQGIGILSVLKREKKKKKKKEIAKLSQEFRNSSAKKISKKILVT